jgi:hypothetical protein
MEGPFARASAALDRVISNEVGLPACPICRSTAFYKTDRPFFVSDREAGPVTFSGDEEGQIDTGFPVVIRVCDRCGFVSSHAMRVLDRQPEARESQQQ